MSASVVNANSTSCYVLGSDYPLYSTMSWYTNSSLNSNQVTAAINATATWNYAYTGQPVVYYHAGNSSATIVFNDSTSEVGKVNFYTIGFPGSSNAANALATSSGRIQSFDLLLNDVQAWGDGYSNYYNDNTGIFTHEFGHSLGLDDYSAAEGSGTWSGDSDVPTMWYSNRATATRLNLTYYMRDLSNGDIQGIKQSLSRF